MSQARSDPGTGRLVSLDAYRGFVMLAMASGGLALAELTSNESKGLVLDSISYHAEHTLWRGCSFWDLIQPSFMFIVGVALPFADARRAGNGQPWRVRFGHALVRSAILVFLGVFLASNWSNRTNFVFTNVLAQIGLGYPILFLLHDKPPRAIFAAVVAILVGYWALFAFSPIPDPEMAGAGLPNWARLHGFASHWSKHSNPAADFDRWFLNLFPRPDGEPYTINEGGYQTLNFIPSLATMLIGVLAGQWLRSPRDPKSKVLGLVAHRRRLPDPRHCSRRHDLPGRQADLDPFLDHLQLRLDALAARALLPDHRREGLEGLVLPVRGGRPELDRDVHDGPAHQALGAEDDRDPRRHPVRLAP